METTPRNWLEEFNLQAENAWLQGENARLRAMLAHMLRIVKEVELALQKELEMDRGR